MWLIVPMTFVTDRTYDNHRLPFLLFPSGKASFFVAAGFKWRTKLRLIEGERQFFPRIGNFEPF